VYIRSVGNIFSCTENRQNKSTISNKLILLSVLLSCFEQTVITFHFQDCASRMRTYTDNKKILSLSSGDRAIAKASPRSNSTNDSTKRTTFTSTAGSSVKTSSIGNNSSSGPRLPKARACYICGRQYMVKHNLVINYIV